MSEGNERLIDNRSRVILVNIIFVFSAIALVFVFSWGAYIRNSEFKVYDFILYFGMIVVAPCAGCISFFVIRDKNTENNVARSALTMVLMVTIIILHFPFSAFIHIAPLIILIFMIVVVYSYGILNIVESFNKKVSINIILNFLSRSLPIVTFLLILYILMVASKNASAHFYWPHSDSPMGAWGFDIKGNRPNERRIINTAFVLSILAFIIITFKDKFIIHHFTKTNLFTKLCIFAISVIALYSFVDPTLFYEIQHYSAFVGPLMGVKFGKGWPLIDVYGQYGLSYIVYAPVLSVLHRTFSSVALITNLANIGVVLIAFFIVIRSVGISFLTIVLSVLFVYFVWFSFPYNLTFTPSVLGVRWLPVWLLVLALVSDRDARNPVGMWSLGALNISALWSIETHIVALICTSVHVALRSRILGHSIPISILFSFCVAPLSFIGHACFILCTLLISGVLPDYMPYFEILFSYGTVQEIEWLFLAKKFVVVNTWLVAALIYALVLSLALIVFFSGKTVLFGERALVGLSALSALGVATSVYFVGRPTQPMLAVTVIPVYGIIWIVLIVFIRGVLPFIGRWKPVATAALVLLFSLTLGYSWDRLRKPFNGGPLGSANASLLGRCIQFGKCNPISELRRVYRLTRVGLPTPSGIGEHPHVRSLSDLYRKHSGAAPAIALVTSMRTAALMSLGATDGLVAGNLDNDVLSPRLLSSLRRQIQMMPRGSVLLRGVEAEFIEYRLLCDAGGSHVLEEIDGDERYRVDRLSAADEAFERGGVIEGAGPQTMISTRTGGSVQSSREAEGLIQRVRSHRGTFLIEGWVDGGEIAAPRSIIFAVANRIVGFAKPGVAIVEGNSAPQRRFRLFLCGTEADHIATLRAFSISPDGQATEIRVSRDAFAVPPP